MRRRTLLASAVAATAMLVGYRADADVASEPDQRIMLIRHAEKPPKSGLPYGLTAQGVQDVHALTTDGWQRAGALVELFARTNESLRPTQTVTPLAQRLGLTVTHTFTFEEEAVWRRRCWRRRAPHSPRGSISILSLLLRDWAWRT